jgi:triosephosphate isomerase
MRRLVVGVSLKAYFGRRDARAWFAAVAERLRDHASVRGGRVTVFVIPSFLQIDDAAAALSGVGVAIGAQDVSAYPPGAYTGEISADELSESGALFVEIGHAERRRLFGETEAVVAEKTAAALGAGLVPVLCLGEDERADAAAAARTTVAQLRSALEGAADGPVVVAYEPVWAIGAAEPAPVDHIVTVTRAVRAALDALPGRTGSSVIYGGSAGPGLLTRLGDDVDGLFLGRFAHDPDALVSVLDEAVALDDRRRGVIEVAP